MAFTFEALPARYGDSLFLTFDEPGRKLRLLIDGGPSLVYEKSVKPRLAKEAAAAGDDTLVLDAVMVSHIDEDHIKGILDLLGDLRDADEAQRPRPCDVRWLLHNSFDALLNESEGGTARALGGTTVLAGLGGEILTKALGRELDHTAELVLASYNQGSQLASLAGALQITRNPPDGSPIMSVDDTRVLQFGSAELKVVGPRQRELDKLRAAWRKWQAALKAKQSPGKALAATLDESVPNLSSIVCMVEHGGKRALITGDARADYILDGLETAGILPAGGEIEIDVLKLPHHGSIRNVTDKLFQRVKAKHYVASGDGTYGNPDRATLELLEQVRPEGGYHVHLTYTAEDCDRVHEAWRRDRKGPKYSAARDGVLPIVSKWRKPKSKIKVHEGPVSIVL